MKKVLAVAPVYSNTQDKLEGLYDVVRFYADEDAEKMNDQWLEDCEVAVTNSGCGADGSVLSRMPGLRLVANFGTGVDKIDLQYCRERGLAVTHTPDVLTDEVAHLAISLMLSTVRRLPAAERFLRSGQWQKGRFALTRSLKDMKIGIVGLGRIGHAIARLCEPFGCRLAYSGPNKKDTSWQYFSQCNELAAWADILVVSCLGGDSTIGLISADVLKNLGENGYLVNIARGTVVDERALVESLKVGGIASAGLDVFAVEPNVPEELLAMENVVLLPHVGSATHDTRTAMGECMLANVAAYFRAEPLPNVFTSV